MFASPATFRRGQSSSSRLAGLCLALAACLVVSRSVDAAGLLLADGGLGGRLEVEEHRVQVTVNNGVAVTDVTQVFRNLENRQVEALYTFPVPANASISNFSMWIDGKEMVGEVLEKERAREIYDSYKAQGVDPGLLEQADYKTFEMRIFPINAGAQQRVQITYYQELDHDHNWVTFVYPLATVTHKDLDSRTTGAFSLSVDVKSAVPIVEMESPSHTKDFVIARHAESYYQGSLETQGGDLNRDVVLAYKLARPKSGLDLIASRQKGEDGYLCLMLTAGADLEKLDDGMDYVFVLDISGSMLNGNKLALSRGSVEAFVKALGDEDRFEIVTFNVQPHTLFDELQTAGDETRAASVSFLASQEARGGTVLSSAIELAYRYGDPDRQLNVVVLSDGMTQQDEARLLGELIRKRPSNARVFCIGIGNEVNRPLLEEVARESGGLASFISRGDNFDRQANAFRRKLTRPAATEVALEFEGGDVYDTEPRGVSALYHGTPLRVYARFRDAGPLEVKLKANVLGRAIEKSVRFELPEVDGTNPEIERMWAWRRTDRLLKVEDRGGRDGAVRDEIVLLGEAYSIVTEYTSFLVLENDEEYQRWKIERNNLRRTTRDRRARQALVRGFEDMRRNAVAGLGPEAVKRDRDDESVAPEQLTSAAPPSVRNSMQAPRQGPAAGTPPASSQGRNVDFSSTGTGPFGPFIAAFAVWIASRTRRCRRSDASTKE